MEKRQYQEDIIQDVLNSRDNVLVVAPTGSGKTYIAKRIATKLKKRVLFVTPRIDLVSQTVEAFGGNCDILWGKYNDSGAHITVASRQTLALRKNLTFENWVVILDEVHIGLPKSFELIERIKPARVIGLTATPERMDGLSFLKTGNGPRFKYALFDRVLEKVTIQDLQRDGYLAELDYSAAKFNSKLTKIKTSFDELRYSQFKDVVETPEAKANLTSFLRAHSDQKPFLIFTPDVDSAYYWKDEINKMGFNLVAVDGSMKKDERQTVYDEVKEGKYDGIVNCALLTYGFDMPCAKTVVLIRNVKSRPLYIQVIGRVLRPFEGKKAIVYDMGGSCWNFCSLKHPVLFDRPIKYAVEGFDAPPSEMKSDINEIASLVGEAKVHQYIEDPLETLQEVLYAYKEEFEIQLMNATNRIKSEANVVLDKQKSEIKSLERDLGVARDALKRSSGPVTDPKLWFKLPEAFEWFRRNMPTRVLRPMGYDKSMQNDPEVLKKVYLRVVDELPVIVNKDNIEYCMKQIQSYSKWWLSHFELAFNGETKGTY